MTAFDLTLAHPLGPVSTGGLGGPGEGRHTGAAWHVGAGMDLGAPAGTRVRASFDGQITRFDPADDTRGVRLFVGDASGRVGACYTHLTDVPFHLDVGAMVRQGEPIGRVAAVPGVVPHLHLALCEVLRGRSGGQRVGVDLYATYLAMSDTHEATAVTFFQCDGVAPVPAGGDRSRHDPGAWAIDVGSLLGVQRALVSLGFDPGVPNGIDDARSQRAVRAFQSAYGLSPDGVLDGASRRTLAAALAAAGLHSTVA